MNDLYTRRTLFKAAISTVSAVTVGNLFIQQSNAASTSLSSAKEVWIVEFSAAGARTGRVRLPKIMKSEAEWQNQLSPASYQITRQEGTEQPFTGKYLNVHEAGIFRCIYCNTALFDSHTKFESGTGWLVFTKRLPKITLPKPKIEVSL